MNLAALLDGAAERRGPLLRRLAQDGTDCWRMLHGTTEGLPGVAVDRYGDLVLVHASRAAGDAVEPLVAALRERAPPSTLVVVADRRADPIAHAAAEARSDLVCNEFACNEAGMRCLVRARHTGQDPWLFLDLRAGRRRILELARGRSVLNLFAYTCTAGIAAALGGATEVLNVDFSATWLDVGRRIARLNELRGERVRFLREDCLAVLRQLAGQPVARRRQQRTYQRIEARRFGLVILDPPRLSKSSFGTVDLVHDYQSLFKPAWLATEEGGFLIATNNVASVDRDRWLDALRRCADKAGRPIGGVEVVEPDGDFPSSDGRPPLKLAVCSA